MSSVRTPRPESDTSEAELMDHPRRRASPLAGRRRAFRAATARGFIAAPYFQQRYQHGHTGTVCAITLPIGRDQVTLLEADPNQDIPARRDGEQEVSDAHEGRRPEGDDEAKVDGMPHHPVQPRRLEVGTVKIAAPGVRPDLPQSEQLEVIDEESRDQQQGPADPESAGKYRPECRPAHVPDGCGDWTPLPEEQRQNGAGGEYERAALDVPGHEPRP